MRNGCCLDLPAPGELLMEWAIHLDWAISLLGDLIGLSKKTKKSSDAPKPNDRLILAALCLIHGACLYMCLAFILVREHSSMDLGAELLCTMFPISRGICSQEISKIVSTSSLSPYFNPCRRQCKAKRHCQFERLPFALSILPLPPVLTFYFSVPSKLEQKMQLALSPQCWFPFDLWTGSPIVFLL